MSNDFILYCPFPLFDLSPAASFFTISFRLYFVFPHCRSLLRQCDIQLHLVTKFPLQNKKRAWYDRLDPFLYYNHTYPYQLIPELWLLAVACLFFILSALVMTIMNAVADFRQYEITVITFITVADLPLLHPVSFPLRFELVHFYYIPDGLKL